MIMAFDVTFKRMGGELQHILQIADTMEQAIEFTKDQYPGCLVINALLIN